MRLVVDRHDFQLHPVATDLEAVDVQFIGANCTPFFMSFFMSFPIAPDCPLSSCATPIFTVSGMRSQPANINATAMDAKVNTERVQTGRKGK